MNPYNNSRFVTENEALLSRIPCGHLKDSSVCMTRKNRNGLTDSHKLVSVLMPGFSLSRFYTSAEHENDN